MNQNLNNIHNDDSMDICLCKTERNFELLENESIEFNDAKKFQSAGYIVTYAGAKRPLFYGNQQNQKISMIKGSINSTGGKYFSNKHPFTNSEIYMQKRDTLYLTSDVYIDQPSIKSNKFGTKKFCDLLSNAAQLPINSQNVIIETILDEHQQNSEQRDDITVLGIKL